MTTRFFSLFIILIAVIFSGWLVNAASVTCENMKRQCSSTYKLYELEAAACTWQQQAFNCSAYKNDRDLGRFVRKCTPEAICEERSAVYDISNLGMYCTGLTKSGVKDAARKVLSCAHSFTCMAKKTGDVAVSPFVALYDVFKDEADIVRGFTENPSGYSSTVLNGALEYNRRWQCLNPAYKIAASCRIYGGALSSAMTLELAKGAPKGAEKVEVAVTTVADSAALAVGSDAIKRRLFINGMIKKQFTTVGERQAYVDVALKTTPDGRTVFLDVQNSYMKVLNDTLADKNLVTALTNRRLQMTFDRLATLKKKYPDIETLKYDDFKSGRIAFRSASGKLPAAFQKDVQSMIESTNREFAAEVQKRGLLPAGAKVPSPDQWFTAGWGATGDQANAAARYARRSTDNNVLRDFAESTIQRNLQQGLRQTETLRSGLAQSSLKKTDLLERTPDGKMIPSMDVFEAYRKTNSSGDLAKALSERTGHPVSAQQAQMLRTYIDSVNELSPSIHVVEARQIVSFTGSKANGVMADVTSMGALNLSQEAIALTRSTSVADAVVKSRVGEQEATRIFNANKDAIVKAGSDALKSSGANIKVLVSGDDILFQPTRELSGQELEQLHRAVAQSSSTANVRLSAVNAGVRNANRVGVRGELLEKKTRSLTLSSVPDQKKYTLMVVTGKSGQPVLKVEARAGATVDPVVEKSYQDAFDEALKKVH